MEPALRFKSSGAITAAFKGYGRAGKHEYIDQKNMVGNDHSRVEK